MLGSWIQHECQVELDTQDYRNKISYYRQQNKLPELFKVADTPNNQACCARSIITILYIYIYICINYYIYMY